MQRILLLLLLIITSCKIKYPVKTVCIVTKPHEPGPHGGSPFIYGYKVNEKRYENEGYISQYILMGEKFEMEYDSIHPSRSKIYTDKPIFFESDNIIHTTGIITHANCGRSYTIIDFEYLVNGISYKKHQVLKGYIFIKEGDKFDVAYLEKIPPISIININNPLEKKEL